MKFDLFLTDKCFIFLLCVTLLAMVLGLRKQHIRAAYQRIFQRPVAVSAAMIVLFFLVIGFIDSIHFRVQSDYDQVSLLDRIMAPLGEQYEKTYSAPMALTLFSTEQVTVQNETTQVHPRLSYLPASIRTTQDIWNITQHVLVKAFLGSLLLVIGIGCIWILVKRLLMPKRMPWGRISPAMASGLITLFFIFFIVLASFWLSRYFHVLGTGKIGQDMYYYSVKSIRTGMIIGTLTTLFMMPLALLFGISAGYFGGTIDDIIQYIYTTLSSIPGVLLITASVLSLQTYITNHPQQFPTIEAQADIRLLALCLILGVTSWTSLCRLLRAEALKLREMDFVLAAKILGTRSFRILSKHLLPNVLHIVVITLVLDFSFLVLAEAVLSYVGVGVSPLTMSWGNMINAARLELAREPIVWWPVVSAFTFMFVLVLASNLLADAVRDALDPRG